MEAALILLAYLIGSIPAAVWISKYIYGADVRAFGSGNAGSTNMFRTFGFAAGLATQLIDIAKGAAATLIPVLFFHFCDPEKPCASHEGVAVTFFGTWERDLVCLIFGLAAVTGHVWPVLAGFRGGKGVNSLLGMMLVVDPIGAAIGLGVFVITLLLSRMVSLASMSGALSFPIYLAIAGDYPDPDQRLTILILGILTFLLVVYTHRTNIVRILEGRENKISIKKA